MRYDTTLGAVDVRLFDSATPLSVTNFLSYANTDRWDDTFIHRSIAGFVVQGGGFSLTPDIFNITNVTTDTPVLNEPMFTNIRGTVAYAKLGGDPNSATSQWFFNLDDNAANLDNQNGGFTVFGRVVGNGMDVIDSIAALQTINTSTFSGVPVLDFDKVVGQQNVLVEDAVIINDVSVLNIPDGDYNFDGSVDGADLTVWQTSNGSTTEVAADGNGNGIVDGDDYLIWQNNLGATTASLSTLSVPEPTTIVLAALSFVALCVRR